VPAPPPVVDRVGAIEGIEAAVAVDLGPLARAQVGVRG
jgi:hypothetical protein